MDKKQVESQLDRAIFFGNSHACSVGKDSVGWRGYITNNEEGECILNFRLGAYSSTIDAGFAVDSILDRLKDANIIDGRTGFVDQMQYELQQEGDLNLTESVKVLTRKPLPGSTVAELDKLKKKINPDARTHSNVTLQIETKHALQAIYNALQFEPPAFMKSDFNVAARHANNRPQGFDCATSAEKLTL